MPTSQVSSTHSFATPERILYRQFLEGGWRDVSAHEIAAYAARWQAFLRAEGLAPGDRVALCLKKRHHWVAATRCARLGIVVVPLYADDNPEKRRLVPGDSGARLLVAENSRMADALQGVTASLPRVRASPPIRGAAMTRSRRCSQAGAGVRSRALADDALATICYTSGTAGRPKG